MDDKSGGAIFLRGLRPSYPILAARPRSRRAEIAQPSIIPQFLPTVNRQIVQNYFSRNLLFVQFTYCNPLLSVLYYVQKVREENERRTATAKKTSQTFKKPLDKQSPKCYNKEEVGEIAISLRTLKIEKGLDKRPKMWYNN